MDAGISGRLHGERERVSANGEVQTERVKNGTRTKGDTVEGDPLPSDASRGQETGHEAW